MQSDTRSRSRRPRLLIAAVLVLIPGVPGVFASDFISMPEPSACGPIQCDLVQPGDPTVYPMGQGSLLELLRPFLDRNTYDLLDDLVGDYLIPPDVDIPPRPTNASVEAEVQARMQIKAAGIHVHASANATAHAHVDSTGSSRETDQTVVPCSDPRGCPDLVVDPAGLARAAVSEETFAADQCAVVEGSTQAGDRRLLRFTFTTPNIGNGDLIIGAVTAHPDWFQWADCHAHHHFREYADYRLWEPNTYIQWLDARQDNPDATAQETLNTHPTLNFIAGHKQGFCVIDVRFFIPTEEAKYEDCADNQGISRGWADEYGNQLDGQWIDITGLPAGAYVLEAEVNAERFYQELDYANNSAAILVMVPP